MSYITLQGLIDRYGETELVQLTDVMGDGQVDSVKVNRAIADATAEIDAYLAATGILPLTDAAALRTLERHAGVLVRYYLYSDAVTDLVQKQYDSTIAFLKAIARGDAHLGPTESGSAAPATAAPSWSTTDSVFNTESMTGF